MRIKLVAFALFVCGWSARSCLEDIKRNLLGQEDYFAYVISNWGNFIHSQPVVLICFGCAILAAIMMTQALSNKEK